MTTIAERLKEAREDLGLSQEDFARLAGVSAGTIGNVESGARKDPRSLLEIAAAARVMPEWLKHGRQPKRPPNWTPPQHAAVGVIVSPVAQNMSHPTFEDAPTTIAWECILTEQLKSEFQTVMPDASMEPDVPRGARVIFITGAEPVPGDWVLCADSDDNLYLREMRQHKPGRWEAHALNPAFLPLDSQRDGLRVVAVFDGLRGRKGRI